MEESNLGKIPIQINSPIRDWTRAMVRNDKDRCVRSCVLQKLTERGVEPDVNVTNRIAKLGLPRRIVKKMGLIHELPEVMLYCIDRHEDEHHDILDAMLKEMESDAGPLFVQLTHFFEHTVTTLVVA